MHASLILRSAEASGAVTTTQGLKELENVLLQSYVDNPNLIFTMTDWEAEELIYRTMHKFNGMERHQLKLHSEGRLEQLWDALLKEESAIAAGQGKVTKEHLEALKQATRQLRMVEFAPGQMRMENMGTETLSLMSHSHLPNDTLIALLESAQKHPELLPELRRAIYHLTDGGHVRWMSNGTHSVGDLYLSLFGPRGFPIPQAVTAGQKQEILMELQFRLNWATAHQDTAQVSALNEAIARMSAFTPIRR
jgi:hypothetical protein